MRVGVSLCILQWIRMRFRKLQCRHAGEKGLLSLPFNNLEHQREMERDQLNAWPNAASAKVPTPFVAQRKPLNPSFHVDPARSR